MLNRPNEPLEPDKKVDAEADHRADDCDQGAGFGAVGGDFFLDSNPLVEQLLRGVLFNNQLLLIGADLFAGFIVGYHFCVIVV